MPQFQFIALDSAGKEHRGTIDAPNRELAASQVKSSGLLLVRLGEKKSHHRKPLSNSLDVGAVAPLRKPMYFGSATSAKALANFTRQLAILLRNGLSLLRSFETLIAQERNPAFKWVLSELASNIRSGNTFSEGLHKFPREFDLLYVNIVKAGEASGTLDTALDRLSLFLNKTMHIRSKVKQAAMYPTVVFGFSVAIVLLLMTLVVPSFANIFETQLQGQELPRLTRIVLGISTSLTEDWLSWLAGVATVFVLFSLFRKTSLGQVCFAFIKLKGPFISDTFTKLYVSRFCRTFGTLLESGVPILDALNYARDAVGNRFVMDAINRVRNRVKDGEALAAPMAATGVFPPMVYNMVEVGEETGQIAEMLGQVADVYDDEVDASVGNVTSIIEPILILALAGFVLVIAISLFLPFVKMMEAIAQ